MGHDDARIWNDLSEAVREDAALAARYLYFSGIAEIEGQLEVAALFRELADGQTCCVHGSLDMMRQLEDEGEGTAIGDTEQNLKAALISESKLHAARYRDMAAEARGSRHVDVASWFDTLVRLKGRRAERLSEILDKLGGARRLEDHPSKV